MLDDTEKRPTGQSVCHVNASSAHENMRKQRPDTTTWPGQHEFIGAIFGSSVGPGKGVVWTTGFQSVASGESWQGRAGVDHLEARFPTMEADLYFAIGVMHESETRRSNKGVVAQPILIVDDIGTKIDRARWNDLFDAGCPRPTARIETSRGNETWVWALDGDATAPERWSDLALIRAYLLDARLTDEVMDVARYVRLPGGWNSKPKYRGPNGDGPPPPVRLVEWRLDTDGRVDVDRLGDAIVGRLSDASIIGPGAWRHAPPPKSASAQALMTSAQISAGERALVRTADLSKPDALLRLAVELGMQPRQEREGVVEALCPNIDAHTTRVETGFAFLGNGLMKCQHASCQGLSTVDFRQMMLEAMDKREGRQGAGREWLSREEQRDAGAFSDTAQAAATAEDMAAAVKERAQQGVAQAVAQTRATIVGNGLDPFVGFDPKAYSPRPFLYGTSVIAGFITVLAAPGGQGKTSVLIADILAMCSGKNLIGEAPVRPLVVQYHSAEDDAAEAGRRIAGAMKHHGLSPADLGGRLFVTSGRGKGARRIKLARMGAKGPEEVPGAVDAVVELATSRKVNVIAFDPLAAMHDLPENDNAAMNFLLDLLRQTADRTGAAIVLTHHTSKAAAQDMDAAGAGAVRGASAVVDGSRVTRTLVRMTPKEATRFGVPEEQRRAFLRIEDAKVNLSPAGSARWVRIVGVPLGNGAGYWPKGDFVGVAEAWTPPTAQPGTGADLARVQAALTASPRPPRADQRSPEWIGWLVARVMGLDTGGHSTSKEDRTPDQAAALARVRAIVAGWVQNGGLVERQEMDADTRKKHRFVFVGQPAVVLDADTSDSPSDTDGADSDE